LAGPASEGLLTVAAAWERRLEALARAGVPADRISLSAGPGSSFDYYDGVRFEVLSAALGPSRPVAAGGRYDGLLARLDGGRAGRAVGCMVRPWRAFAEGEA
jgi:ATP phosphoribosyltransferase regulatory subunit